MHHPNLRPPTSTPHALLTMHAACLLPGAYAPRGGSAALIRPRAARHTRLSRSSVPPPTILARSRSDMRHRPPDGRRPSHLRAQPARTPAPAGSTRTDGGAQGGFRFPLPPGRTSRPDPTRPCWARHGVELRVRQHASDNRACGGASRRHPPCFPLTDTQGSSSVGDAAAVRARPPRYRERSVALHAHAHAGVGRTATSLAGRTGAGTAAAAGPLGRRTHILPRSGTRSRQLGQRHPTGRGALGGGSPDDRRSGTTTTTTSMTPATRRSAPRSMIANTPQDSDAHRRVTTIV
ncbi:MAG: hypothetical protein WDW36_003398 [Sanguina aurantia]